MKTLFHTSTLKKVSHQAIQGKFSLIVPQGTGSTIASYIRTILLSDFPSFGLKSIYLNSFEYTRNPELQRNVHEIIQRLRKCIFTPASYYPNHSLTNQRKNLLKSFPDTKYWLLFFQKKNLRKKKSQYILAKQLRLCFQIKLKSSNTRHFSVKKNFDLSELTHSDLILFHKKDCSNLTDFNAEIDSVSSEFGPNFSRVSDFSSRGILYSSKSKKPLFYSKKILFPPRNQEKSGKLISRESPCRKETQPDTYYQVQKVSISSHQTDQITHLKVLSSKRLFSHNFYQLDCKTYGFERTQIPSSLSSSIDSQTKRSQKLPFPFCLIQFTEKPQLELPQSIKILNPQKNFFSCFEQTNMSSIWVELGFESKLPLSHPLMKLFSNNQKNESIKLNNINEIPEILFSNTLFGSTFQKKEFFPTQNHLQSKLITPLVPIFLPKKLDTSKWVKNNFSNLLLLNEKIPFYFYFVRKSLVDIPSFQDIMPSDLQNDEALYEIDCRPIFPTIRKVNFSIYSINNDIEQIVFEIYTNGSMSPFLSFQYARSKAFEIIRNCMHLFSAKSFLAKPQY